LDITHPSKDPEAFGLPTISDRLGLLIAQLPIPLVVTIVGLVPNAWVLKIGAFFVGLGRAALDIATHSP